MWQWIYIGQSANKEKHRHKKNNNFFTLDSDWHIADKPNQSNVR